MKIISVVGARPNFIKIAPFVRAIEKYNRHISGNNQVEVEHILVHTGQHYDKRMSDSFFELLSIPEPDINLGIGSGSHAEQVGKTMIEFEKVLSQENPDWVVVVGDVNATLACSVTAKKEQIKVCHIEAGIRSGDNKMPEEINRIVTDRVSDLLLTPDKIAVSNLLKEGVNEEKIRLVGNIMIDSLDFHENDASKLDLIKIISLNQLNPDIKDLNPIRNIAVVTLHRPSNVDNKRSLNEIVDFLIDVVNLDYEIVWPVHPRTLKMLQDFKIIDKIFQESKIHLLHPANYLEMLKLTKCASLILTDSGGLQEESTVMGKPCITIRDTTERPLTLIENGGTSILAGNNLDDLKRNYLLIQGFSSDVLRPELWDGNTAERCLAEILKY